MSGLLRPRWIAGHILAVVAVVSFILLGMWQLRRHDEKLTLRTSVEAAVEADPIPLAEAEPGTFARVFSSGRFDPEAEFRVPRAVGGVSGYAVIGTLWPDSGVPVLVERGWVGIDDTVPPPPAEVEVEGVLWPGESGPAPEEIGDFFPRIDPAAVSSVSRYELRSEYLVLTAQSPDFEIPPPELGEVSLGPHLGYAGQWFLFAAVVLVGYPLLLRKRWGRGANPR